MVRRSPACREWWSHQDSNPALCLREAAYCHLYDGHLYDGPVSNSLAGCRGVEPRWEALETSPVAGPQPAGAAYGIRTGTSSVAGWRSALELMPLLSIHSLLTHIHTSQRTPVTPQAGATKKPRCFPARGLTSRILFPCDVYISWTSRPGCGLVFLRRSTFACSGR